MVNVASIYPPLDDTPYIFGFIFTIENKYINELFSTSLKYIFDFRNVIKDICTGFNFMTNGGSLSDYCSMDSNSYQIPTDIFTKILNVSLASRKLESLSFVNEAGETIQLSVPQIHIILYGKPGTFKSTIQRDFIKKVKGINISMLTTATFLGSVDKQGQFVDPVIWDAKGSVLGVDDWHPSLKMQGDKKLFESLLKVLEEGEYTRPFVWSTKSFSKKSGPHSMVMKNNKLTVKCNFVYFASTMKNLVKRKELSTDIEALLSRCLFIPFHPTRQDVDQFMKGHKKFFMYHDIELKEKNPVLKKKDYLHIHEYVFSKDMPLAETTRTVGLLCKIFAITGEHDFDLYEEIIKLRRLI